MKTEEVDLTAILEKSRQQLKKPLTLRRRRLLFLLNLTYLCLTPIFLLSEKLATGHFVPHTVLAVVYSLVGVTNLLSGLYNYLLLNQITSIQFADRVFTTGSSGRFDTLFRWLSVLSIMVMSICHMAGLGNPSQDAILTDFALGHSLIVLVAMLLGRLASFLWFLLVLGLLFYVTFGQRGYTYQYNYLTPAESTKYEKALSQGRPWAVARSQVLQDNNLNPPKVSRYFNVWFIFIFIAFLTGYHCLAITIDVYKILPTVTEDIKNAIDTAKRQEIAYERERSQVEEQKLLVQQEALRAELKQLKTQINPHFLYNTLNYFYIKSSELSEDLAEAVLKLSDIMRYSMKENVNEVTLVEEIQYMNQFIALHQLRNENRLFISFTVHGDVSSKKIIPFLFIGLIENSFKHGKMNTPDKPLVINIDVRDERILFETRNYKNKKKRVDSNHIGLSNLQRRLELTYHQNHSFRTVEDEDMFYCTLEIYT